MDGARSIGSTSRPLRETNQSKPSAHLPRWTLRALPQIGQHNPRRSQKNSPKGSGATPAGSLACPHGNLTTKKSLYSSASARLETRGLLSRISVRGTLTDVHSESIRTGVEVTDSTPPLVARTVIDDHGLEHGKSLVRIDWGSTAGIPRIQKQARTN